MQCVAVFYGVLQCVAMYFGVLQSAVVCCSVLHAVAVCCTLLQCVARCCSVLHAVAKSKRVHICKTLQNNLTPNNRDWNQMPKKKIITTATGVRTILGLD